MGIDFTGALAHLLTDSELRERFARDRSRTLDQLDVRADDRPILLQLDLGGLEAQARTLVDKRRDGTMQWLPRTWRRLGSDAEHLFRDYALAGWPAGLDRSIVDARSFCRFLHGRGDARLCPIERSRLEILANGRSLGIRLARAVDIAGRQRTVLHFLLRLRGGTPIERIFYFEFPH